jgi:type I restriction enzyme S subunit
MKKTYQAYPKMKKNNIEWLGDIPVEWYLSKVKYISSINTEVLSEKTGKDCEISYIDISNVDSFGNLIELKEMIFGDAPSRARRIVKHGDTILSTVRTYLKAIAYIDSPPSNLIASTGFAVLRSLDKIHPRYLFYFLASEGFVQAVVSHSTGVSYPAIASSQVGDFSCCVPTLPEQQAIANFLDRKTSLIDDLIAKKELMIKLLKEKRQATITQAVTRGLDAYVDMDDSGVKWIGKKPSSWKAKRLKFACRINPSKSELGDFDKDTEVSFLPMDKISEDGYLTLDETRRVADVYQGFTYFRDKDVIMAKITPCFENGKGAICHNLTNGIGFGTTELHVFRAHNEILPDFLHYITKSYPFRVMGEAFMQGAAGQKRVTENFICNFVVTVPPIDEQKTIVKYVNNKIHNIDGVVDKQNEQVEKLKEYRQSLISKAVTGKIKVNL